MQFHILHFYAIRANGMEEDCALGDERKFYCDNGHDFGVLAEYISATGECYRLELDSYSTREAWTWVKQEG